MQVQREKPKPSRRGRVSCLGCLAVLGACLFFSVLSLVMAFILLRDQVTTAALSLAGFQTEGQTAVILATNAPVVPTAPPMTNISAPPNFSVAESRTSPERINLQNNQGVSVQAGTTAEGEMATITTTERELAALCQTYTNACGPRGITEQGFTIRNASIDLFPGGVVVNADFAAPNLPVPQNLGLVFQVGPTGDNLILRGVDVGGMLFSQPPAELAGVVQTVQQDLDRIVQEAVVDVGGAGYSLNRIVIDDETVTLVLK